MMIQAFYKSERLYYKKLDNSDVPIWRKVEKAHSFVILRRLKGMRGDSKIRLEHFCCLSMFYLTAKFQKKSNEQFSRNCVTYERTNERDSLGLQQLRRETKTLANSNERIAKKNAKNLHFWAFFAKKATFGSFWPK